MQRLVTLLTAIVLPLCNTALAQDGQALYLGHCASCHGANVEGQPNWMQRKPDGRLPAPPHHATGHTWHHSDRQLFQIVRDGLALIAPGYQSDIRPFAGVLSDDEIRAVLEYIKSTWPARQREIQAAKSAADPAKQRSGAPL